MDSTSIILGLGNIFVATIFIILSIPLVKSKVPMNKIYGVRIKKAFESEENWYKINAYGGKQLILWSIPLVLLGIATFFLPLKENCPMITVVACAPLIVLVPVVMSCVYAKKL